MEVVPNRPSYLRVSSTPGASVSEDTPELSGNFLHPQPQPKRSHCDGNADDRALAPRPSVVGATEEIDQQPRGKKSSHTPLSALSVVGRIQDLSGHGSSVVGPLRIR